MEDIVTDIQREVFVNTANINQVRIDLNDMENSIRNILSLTNDIKYEVEDIKKQLQYLRERVNL